MYRNPIIRFVSGLIAGPVGPARRPSSAVVVRARPVSQVQCRSVGQTLAEQPAADPVVGGEGRVRGVIDRIELTRCGMVAELHRAAIGIRQLRARLGVELRARDGFHLPGPDLLALFDETAQRVITRRGPHIVSRQRHGVDLLAGDGPAQVRRNAAAGARRRWQTPNSPPLTSRPTIVSVIQDGSVFLSFRFPGGLLCHSPA